jgi:hypothetical protein
MLGRPILWLSVLGLPVWACKGGGRLSLLVGHHQHLSLRLALCLAIDETPRTKVHPLSLLGASWEAKKTGVADPTHERFA